MNHPRIGHNDSVLPISQNNSSNPNKTNHKILKSLNYYQFITEHDFEPAMHH